MAQDGGKVVSLKHQPPLPPENALGTHFCYRLSRTQRHSVIGEGLCQRKIPMTPCRIEKATFRFVAQHLNHCATVEYSDRCKGEITRKFIYFKTVEINHRLKCKL